MRGPKLWIILAASAVAVGFQNYVFFSSQGGAPRVLLPEFEEEFEGAEEDFEETLARVDSGRLARWIETLPAPGRSPFLTQVESDALGGPVATALPRLAGTLWSRDRRVAWIGGHPHSEGDWVGDHWVERIEPFGVVLRQGESRVQLRASDRRETDTDEPETEDPDEDPIDED